MTNPAPRTAAIIAWFRRLLGLRDLRELEAMRYVSLRRDVAISMYMHGWDKHRSELFANVLKNLEVPK